MYSGLSMEVALLLVDLSVCLNIRSDNKGRFFQNNSVSLFASHLSSSDQ